MYLYLSKYANGLTNNCYPQSKKFFHLSENPTAPLPHHIVPPGSGKQWFHSRLLLTFRPAWLLSEIRSFFISMELETKFMRACYYIDWITVVYIGAILTFKAIFTPPKKSLFQKFCSSISSIFVLQMCLYNSGIKQAIRKGLLKRFVVTAATLVPNKNM